MLPAGGGLGGAPGPPRVVKLRGAAGEPLVPEGEGEHARLAGVRPAALRALPRDGPLQPGQLLRHVGVHPRLAAPPAALGLPEGDDAEQHLASVEVGGGEAAAAVPVAGVRHQLRGAAGGDQPGAEGADLVPLQLRPEGPAVCAVHDADPGSLHYIREHRGARAGGDQPEPGDLHRGVLPQQVPVPHWVREADGHHPAVVGGHLSAHLEEGDVVPSEYVIELVCSVPLGVDGDGLDLHSASWPHLRPPGHPQVHPDVLGPQPRAGVRAPPGVAVLGYSWKRIFTKFEVSQSRRRPLLGAFTSNNLLRHYAKGYSVA